MWKIHQDLFKQVEVSKNGTILYIIDPGNNLFQLKLNLHYLRQQNYIDDLKTRINNFFNKKNEDFSSNIQGNVSGRDSPTQPNSPVYIIKNLVGN